MTLWKHETLSLLPLVKWCKHHEDLLLVWLLKVLGAIAGLITLLILGFLIKEALPVLGEVGIKAFFSDESWNPSQESYNLVPMIWGTVLTASGAVLLATPLGIISALFCQYYAPKAIAIIYRRLIELLAGIPSVVYGFWGLVVLVPLINRLHPPGTSLLAGIMILTLMILPTIALIADATFAEVPQEYLLGASALGLSSWGTIWQIVLPVSKSGLMTGTILEIGRAVGETMAVLMVCGNVVQTPKGIFDPVRTLTANIALEMAYALDNHRSALFVSGLLLLSVIIVLAIASGSSRTEAVMRERKQGMDRAIAFLFWLVPLLITAIFIWILGDIVRGGIGQLNWAFLTTSPLDTGRGGGIAPILVSTLLILAVCLVASLPLGVGTAILLAEYTDSHNWFGRLVRRSLDILAGVPSIVFGLFGNAFFATTLGLGFSILSGGLTLACMVLPILIRSTEAGLSTVPDEYRLGSASLGISRTSTLWHLLLPAATPGLLVGLVLGIGRALAETAALIFTSGYVDRMPTSLLDSGRSLSIHIFDLSMNVTGGDENAYASALVLILLLLAINAIAALLAGKYNYGHD